MDPAARRKIRNHALLVWALVVGPSIAFSIPSGPSPSPLAFLLWLAGMVIIALLELPLVFVLSFVEYRLRSRFQERRHPRPIPEPQYAAARVTAPFRFTGTRWKTSVGVPAFVFALVLPAWLLPASGQFVPMLFVLRWLGLALAALAVPAIFLGFRTVTYEVDDLGVRVQRPIRCFEVRWDAMVQIESARIPSVPWAYDTEGPNRMMYGLRTKDGAVVGGVVPFAELGRGNGEVFERALWAWAAKHEIPVIEVHWRATRSWRQRRRAIRA